jgi:hypothetical protein
MSKSPQALRGSAQDHTPFSKGSVQTTQNSSPEPENANAREVAGEHGSIGPDASKDTMNSNAISIWKENG